MDRKSKHTLSEGISSESKSSDDTLESSLSGGYEEQKKTLSPETGGHEEQSQSLSPSGPRFKRLGSGMDKVYYYDGVSEKGWIETSRTVIGTELGAYAKLSEYGVTNIPKVDTDTPPPTLYDKDGTTVVTSTAGYWIEHVPHTKTLKPIMNSTFGVIKSTRDELRAFKEDEEKKGVLINGLLKIQSDLDQICTVVGELTIAINLDSGVPYLLDVSPAGTSVGGEDLASKAAVGISNMIKFLG